MFRVRSAPVAENTSCFGEPACRMTTGVHFLCRLGVPLGVIAAITRGAKKKPHPERGWNEKGAGIPISFGGAARERNVHAVEISSRTSDAPFRCEEVCLK